MCLVGIVSDWRGPEPSFVLVRLVPLFPEPFFVESESDGGVALLDCSTNTTGWCVRRGSSGKAVILRAASGLTRQELCAICTDGMAGGERKVGRKRRKMQ